MNTYKNCIRLALLFVFCHDVQGEFGGNAALGLPGLFFDINNRELNPGMVIDLGYFSIEHTETGLGIEVNPMQYSYNFSLSRHSLSIINAMAYWNMLTVVDEKYHYIGPVFGPFASIQYLDLVHIRAINTFTYTIGLRFIPDKEVWQWWSAELGYKNDNDRNQYAYFTIRINVLGLLLRPLFTGGSI